jgi:hypothetical protein
MVWWGLRLHARSRGNTPPFRAPEREARPCLFTVQGVTWVLGQHARIMYCNTWSYCKVFIHDAVLSYTPRRTPESSQIDNEAIIDSSQQYILRGARATSNPPSIVQLAGTASRNSIQILIRFKTAALDRFPWPNCRTASCSIAPSTTTCHSTTMPIRWSQPSRVRTPPLISWSPIVGTCSPSILVLSASPDWAATTIVRAGRPT